MKIIKLLYVILLFLSGIVNGQNGLGTLTPDSSSILDLSSTSKGFLIPRMTTEQRDEILVPANGLVIFNTTKNLFELNSGTNLTINWISISEISSIISGYESVNAVGEVSTDSINDILIPEMIIIPTEGTYSISFESQFNNSKVAFTTSVGSGGISTSQGVADLQNIYDQLNSKVVTDATHGAILGNGETLNSGVYSMLSAVALLGNLTLDGQNNPDAVFLFKIGAAFNAGAGATITLTNGAKACNVFWVVEAAIVLGANTVFKGLLLSHGAAVGAGANCIIEGRMFSTAAALTSAADFITMPTDCSYINMGILNSFAMFTSIGAITNTAISSITGNIGSNIGAITGFEASTLNGTIYSPNTPVIPYNIISTTTQVDNNNKVSSTFSIYQNGAIILSSTKTLISTANASNISLQAIATVESGEPIEVRWKTSLDKITIGNRVLTLIKIP
jgi:hypothetical protein